MDSVQVQIQGPEKLLSFGTELKRWDLPCQYFCPPAPNWSVTKQALESRLTAHVCANLTWAFLAQPTEGKNKAVVCTKIRIAECKEFGPMFSQHNFKKYLTHSNRQWLKKYFQHGDSCFLLVSLLQQDAQTEHSSADRFVPQDFQRNIGSP